MAEQLKIDTTAVAGSARVLSATSQDVSDSAGEIGAIAEAVGQPVLSDAVAEFVGWWDSRKGDLAEEVSRLETAARSVADSLDAADASLARSLSTAGTLSQVAR